MWQLSRGVQLREGQRARVRLDVPSARTMISRVCGDATLRERLGYVRGPLRDAEHGGRTVRGTVRVQWLEFAVARAGMERSVPTLFADTDEDGSFTACGVPTEGILRVRGWSGADSSGAAELTVPPDGILLRDLYVGRARRATIAAPADSADTTRLAPLEVMRGDGRLRGTTQQSLGPALANVRLSVWGGRVSKGCRLQQASFRSTTCLRGVTRWKRARWAMTRSCAWWM